eukprot:TRINITY_DN32832_c0_g1_i1.p1 TRINITY_DN32832_c0_g1~~TRINITY_DN32832_c0_g1_i1.p1  ORF type:complete len:263 (-),score=44.53 TRINITY_DN32832_c0_g1_i1:193-981(-)
MPSHIVRWLTGVGAAISIKLSSSIDDVVWLAPFLTANTSWGARTTNTLIYISVCLVQTVLAMCIAYSGDKFVQLITRDSKDAWSSDKILTVFSGSVMALYSIKLIYEYIQEWNEEDTAEDAGDDNKYNKVNADDPEKSTGVEMTAPRQGSRQLSARNRTIETASEEAADNNKKEENQSQTLFVIAFIGSLDDLTLFVPMLVGKGFDLVQLVVGGFIAASIIVTICIFLGLCQPVADCLSKVPLFAIVIAFAIMLLVKAVSMD